jgi:hypothetical protein
MQVTPASVNSMRAQPAGSTTTMADNRVAALETQMTTLQQTMTAIAAQLGCTNTSNATVGQDTLASVRSVPAQVAAANFSGHTLAQVIASDACRMASGDTTSSRRHSGVPLDSLPSYDIVSPSVRQAITDGKDVNLNTLLIAGYEQGEVKSIELGQDVVRIKNNDHRLSKILTISEFMTAFGIYTRVMCDTFPLRLNELLAYQRHILEMHNTFPGSAFYAYHKHFSAAAAQAVQRGDNVDWSHPVQSLINRVSSGRKSIACDICNSIAHQTGWCLHNLDRPSQSHSTSNDTAGKTRGQLFKGVEICNHFNRERGCFRKNCKYSHVCSSCFSDHSAVTHNKPGTAPATATRSGDSRKVHLKTDP